MSEVKKRIVVIRPDGTEETIDGPPENPDWLPTGPWMRETVGGPYELVRVLRQDLPGFVFTYMVVHEEGLLRRLPRNEKATDLYLANVRRQFPRTTNALAEAKRQYTQRMSQLLGGNVQVHDLSPPGYADDPFIAGTVVWFDGWTVDELDGLEGFLA